MMSKLHLCKMSALKINENANFNLLSLHLPLAMSKASMLYRQSVVNINPIVIKKANWRKWVEHATHTHTHPTGFVLTHWTLNFIHWLLPSYFLHIVNLKIFLSPNNFLIRILCNIKPNMSRYNLLSTTIISW